MEVVPAVVIAPPDCAALFLLKMLSVTLRVLLALTDIAPPLISAMFSLKLVDSISAVLPSLFNAIAPP